MRAAAVVVVLASVPLSLLLLVLLGAGLLGGALAMLPPIVAAIGLGERAWPRLLEGDIVKAALLAVVAAAGTSLVGLLLLGWVDGGDVSVVAVAVAVVTYAVGAAIALREDEDVPQRWPIVAGISGLALVVAAAVL